jgi:ribosomal protein L27
MAHKKGGGSTRNGRASGRRQRRGAEGSGVASGGYITALLKYAGTCS